jgi:FixJ family two-component response regulator
LILVTAPNTEVLTVCLLDDDSSVLKATSRLLASSGWTVEPFLDPIAFLRYAETYQPEVVVLDILMPVMNGLEVQRRLRTISPRTRVIILTSKGDAEVRCRAMEAGASAFFLKPVNDNEFLVGIESAASDNGSE